MSIDKETIDKIQSIFMHMQICGRDSVQTYDPSEEYRKHILIGKGKQNNMSAEEVYCNTEKFTAWHKRIWEKRKKEIPFTAYCEWMEEGKVWRVGFTSLTK